MLFLYVRKFKLKVAEMTLNVMQNHQWDHRYSTLSTLCYRPFVRLSARPTVCPSVCHTGGSVKNS